jgi:hypothetical protein
MKRLLELHYASPLIERAQELIAAAEPIDASHARGERIRRELDRPARSTAAIWTGVPALAIAGLVLFFGASSFAALRLWTVATETDPPSAAPESDVAPGGRSKPGPVERDPVATDTSPEPTSPVVTRRPSAARFEARSSRPQRSSRRVTSASSNPREQAAPAELETSPVTVPKGEQSSRSVASPDAEQSSRAADSAPVASPATTNSELVVRAVRALRREGDPVLAARLLDKYRAKRAADPLREEVLALQIEAAVASADPRATRFAREYLTRYPAGRYADIARRALPDPSP